MINITEYIYIKADINKVWSYLIDFSKGLSFNRFHTSLELPANYSLSKMDVFIITHNFGFGDIEMTAKIIECISLKRIVISEKFTDEISKGFPHTTTFEIFEEWGNTILTYSVTGTYGGRVQDISFTPILRGVIKKEIIKIKNAIESSEEVSGDIKVGYISP